ncbi:MAG: hypothetical protein JNL74_14580 [Fibrobacteres bacterium]|nr:hypothetical protein [Fibrobacterota bacterium]
MKSQELFVALKLLAYGRKPWIYEEIAQSLKIGVASLHRSVKALAYADLFNIEYMCINCAAFEEFLLHGVKYVFPAKPGAIVRGMPTAHSAPAFKSIFKASTQDFYVWPHNNFDNKGVSVEPLYSSAPEASLNDPKLYSLLACIDILRIGKAREKVIAINLLKKIFTEYDQRP